MDRFARHIAACNNIASPTGFLAFHMGGAQVGFITPELARALTFRPRDFHFDQHGVAIAGRLKTSGARSDALAAALAVVQALRKVYKAEGVRLEKSRKINRL